MTIEQPQDGWSRGDQVESALREAIECIKKWQRENVRAANDPNIDDARDGAREALRRVRHFRTHETR